MFGGVLSLSAAQISGVADVSLLPNCSDAAPGLYMATVAHGVGLVVYSVYLLISFIGVGNLLETLLRRGLLTSPNGAPKGCLEDCTVEVTEIEDGYECPICLEEAVFAWRFDTFPCFANVDSSRHDDCKKLKLSS